LSTSSRSLDEFDEHTPGLYAHRGWVASRHLSRSGSLLVSAEAVAERRLGEASDDEPEPFAATDRFCSASTTLWRGRAGARFGACGHPNMGVRM
jgi:hypothetical protein